MLAVFLTARPGIYSDAGYRIEDLRVFLPVWAAVVVSGVIVGRRLLARSPRLQMLSLVGIGSLGALYYAIGRPLELAILRGQGATTNEAVFSGMGLEVVVPVLIGVVVLGVVMLVVHSVRVRSYRDLSTVPSFWLSTRHAAAVYLWLGVLLWLHSAAAWLLVRLGTGVRQSSMVDPWLRFVDNVGPHGIIWHLFSWPWFVLACCG